MTDKEWEVAKGKLFVNVDNVHTEAELNDLVCKE